jgi:hypothetical protein
MIDGVKLPYEEYILDRSKMVLLKNKEMQLIAKTIDARIEQSKTEKGISYEAAKCLLLDEYKKMRDENMLPRYYIVENDPEYFDKLLSYSVQGIRNISILTADEYDRRMAFTINYMENGDVI